MPKKRLDELCVSLSLCQDLRKAQAHIMRRNVLVDDAPVDKAGTMVKDTAIIRLKKPIGEFVSRGGEKLRGAHQMLSFEIARRHCVDIGQSTGGFSDYLLQNGAASVIGIDAGYGILHQKIRDNESVCVIERTNARDITTNGIYASPTTQSKPLTWLSECPLVVMDVSFISITKVLPALLNVLPKNVEIISLVKPQFEARREEVPPWRHHRR